MKSKFIKSTIILIIGGAISKLLGMIIKIILTRTISTKGIGLYMLILPTFNLFITLCTLGLPISISKLVSEQKTNSKKLILSTIPVIIIFNLILMLILFLIAPIIANNLLKNSILYHPIIAIGLTLPFICLSSIVKGYFFGKERTLPSTIATIIEQLIRLLLTLFYIPNLIIYGLEKAITGVVLINIVSELASFLILILFLPKNENISKNDFSYNKKIMKDILNIGIPATSSRLIGSFIYFLEPIILTYCLLKVGYSNSFITYEYGIINGYVYPLVLMPSFFTLAISNALLPNISNSYARGNYRYVKKKINQAITFSLMIGIPITLMFIFIPQIPLKLIYNSNEGLNYIKIIAPFCLLYYIQTPLTAVLQAINKSKTAMLGTIYGSIIRTIILFSLSLLKVQLWGLIIATLSNIIFVTIQHIYYVNKYLKDKS